MRSRCTKASSGDIPQTVPVPLNSCSAPTVVETMSQLKETLGQPADEAGSVSWLHLGLSLEQEQ
jgi:hypothetical protein